MKVLVQVFAIVGLMCAISVAEAQMPVQVESKSPDSVGQQLVYQFKGRAGFSSSLTTAFVQDKPRLQVNFVTMDQHEGLPGTSTLYAVVVLWRHPEEPLPLYLTHSVGYCGSQRIADCAGRLIAHVSEQADHVLRISGAANR
jgi:hypothetical protein